MAPTSKENEVLTAPRETSATMPAGSGARSEEATSRPQPVALEVPVTVNGARAVEGSDKREPFSETTRTVLVFGHGAVIRLGSPVSPGQLLFLTNEKTKKEVVCQVVKSKNYRNVSGYVELEFTESVLGFWGMRFPTDRMTPHIPSPSSTIPAAAKNIPVAPLSAAPKIASPVVSASPRITEVVPAQIHAEVKAVAPVAPKPAAPSAPIAAAPVIPTAKKLDVPEIHAPETSSSVAFSVASLLSPPEPHPVLMPSTHSSLPAVGEQTPANEGNANSSDELKQQTARLQEQLSALLLSEAPAAKSARPASSLPALDPSAVSNVAAKVFEIAKTDPSPVKVAPPAKSTPPPVKSYLDTEEVKIPSWLEPLARNAAAPASTQELIEREKAKHAAESAASEEQLADPMPLADVERPPEVELPGIGNLLPLDDEVTSQDHASGGSGKRVLLGAIAAGVLLAAGGGWYLFHPANGVQSTSAPISRTASVQANAAVPGPEATPPPQISVAAPEPTSQSNEAPLSSAPASSAPLTRTSATVQPIPVTRDRTRGAGATIAASATERISRPAPEPESKKPVFGEVHLASPTRNRPTTAQDEEESAPALTNGAAVPNVEGFNAGLAENTGKQPAAPEAPLPIGGDVKSAKLVSQVAPLYPMMAKNQHVSGNVVIDALIDVNGRVTTMKVLSGPTLLHQAAKDALRQWKYQPASLDGKPVAMHLTVTLQFRLQ